MRIDDVGKAVEFKSSADGLSGGISEMKKAPTIGEGLFLCL
jgi:hypothetical protein